MKPEDALKLAVSAEHAQVYVSGGIDRIEFTEAGFLAWLPVVERMVREQVAAEIKGDPALTNAEMADLEDCPECELCERCGEVWRGYAARVARGPQDAPTASVQPASEAIQPHIGDPDARALYERLRLALTCVIADDTEDDIRGAVLTALEDHHDIKAAERALAEPGESVELESLLADLQEPVQPATAPTGDTETTGSTTGGTDEMGALEALARIDCPHTRHYAFCVTCAADAIRPHLARTAPDEPAPDRPHPAQPGPDRTTSDALRNLIDRALEESTGTCPRCKHCDAQVDAVITAILPHTTAIADLYRQAEQDVIALTKRAEQAEREHATTAEAYEAACRISQRAEQEAREYRTANTRLQELNVQRTQRAEKAEAEVHRLTDLLAQYADRGIANGQRAERYRTAWWSARIRAAKLHTALDAANDGAIERALAGTVRVLPKDLADLLAFITPGSGPIVTITDDALDRLFAALAATIPDQDRQ